MGFLQAVFIWFRERGFEMKRIKGKLKEQDPQDMYGTFGFPDANGHENRGLLDGA
jgi:hypothetical protein